jgi:hypothetical protein
MRVVSRASARVTAGEMVVSWRANSAYMDRQLPA